MLPFTWPLLAAASISRATASTLDTWANAISAAKGNAAPPNWSSANEVLLELPSMQLRDFSPGATRTPTLVCPPFALHRATIADFAPGHSLVEILCKRGSRALVTDWRSATSEMKNFSIDTYLADLNVAVDECKGPVNLVGLCQGGWLALVYAARFPEKVLRLVLAGAPVDLSAEASQLSRFVQNTPIEAFEELVREGDGRVRGQQVLDMWGPALAAEQACQVLQIAAESDPEHTAMLEDRFQRWYSWTVDLPGYYYLEVVRRLFKESQIASGQFVALGRRIVLSDVCVPIFLLAARDDELVSQQQLFATSRLVGTPKNHLMTRTEPCGHLSLFLGKEVLETAWNQIADWLQSDLTTAIAS
jgi:poly(3-hydroxyalkanoate) synthetase